MDINAWARKNKKHIAREFVREIGFTTSDQPTAIFTAGLPGAGKTEFTVELLKDIVGPTLRIDMDEIAKLIEGYKPELAGKFRAGASIILERIYDEVVKSKLNFVMDGTFSHSKAIPNVKRVLEHGYKVKLYYIHQEPSIAWKFTQDRELVERREITRAGFIDTYKKLQDNLRILQELNIDIIISIVIKDRGNKVGQITEDINDLFVQIPKFLTNEQLEAVII